MIKLHRFLLKALTCVIITSVISLMGVKGAAGYEGNKASNSLLTVLFKTFKTVVKMETEPETRKTMAQDAEDGGMKIKIGLGTFQNPGIIITITLDGAEMIEGAPPIDGELNVFIAMGLDDFVNFVFQRQIEITLNSGQDGLTGIMPDPIAMQDIELILDLDVSDRADPILSLIWDRQVSVNVGEDYMDPGAMAVADYMGIKIKPESNGVMNMGGMTMPFTEDILQMLFAPTDISDSIVETVIDANGNDITDSITKGESYVFSQEGNYKILYNVTDDNGKSAKQIERHVSAATTQTPHEGDENQPPPDLTGNSGTGDDGDDGGGCFISSIL